MRHADSSPPIPPRFVAFARRYHPSTCGSLRRTPGATSTASGLVSRCPPPAVFKMETTRPPGKPTRTHATRSDPGEVAASTASETRRDDLPSKARRRPSHSMHFGAQSRGLRAPCERFAPGVTPGPRITRFRLAADLGRMGLDTHRVSNKVSKITSRHLVPLDRAFPAHALVHRKYRRLFSSSHRPRTPGPKGPSDALIRAIVELKSRNPRFGCPRIARIISRTFGVDIDKNVVARVLAKHDRPAPGGSGPSWLSFIGHATDSLWSVDLFRCESIVLQSYWVLVVMDQCTRRLVGFGVHRGSVDAPGLCRMFNAATHGQGGTATSQYGS